MGNYARKARKDIPAGAGRVRTHGKSAMHGAGIASV